MRTADESGRSSSSGRSAMFAPRPLVVCSSCRRELERPDGAPAWQHRDSGRVSDRRCRRAEPWFR